MLIQAPNLTLTLLIVHTFEEQKFKMAAILKDGRHKKYVFHNIGSTGLI